MNGDEAVSFPLCFVVSDLSYVESCLVQDIEVGQNGIYAGHCYRCPVNALRRKIERPLNRMPFLPPIHDR